MSAAYVVIMSESKTVRHCSKRAYEGQHGANTLATLRAAIVAPGRWRTVTASERASVSKDIVKYLETSEDGRM